jgi:hypothetical protein
MVATQLTTQSRAEVAPEMHARWQSLGIGCAIAGEALAETCMYRRASIQATHNTMYNIDIGSRRRSARTHTTCIEWAEAEGCVCVCGDNLLTVALSYYVLDLRFAQAESSYSQRP